LQKYKLIKKGKSNSKQIILMSNFDHRHRSLLMS